MIDVIDTATLKVVATIPVEKNPRDIIWAPDGRFAYVVNEGSNTVSVIDAPDQSGHRDHPDRGKPEQHRGAA